MKRKVLLRILLGLLAVYVLYLAAQLILHPTISGPSLTHDPLELRGAYHIHTRFSDGRKTPEEIAHIASELSLDFIILTDHGEPNMECLEAAGWMHGVLVLSGSELSVNRGHLVGLGFAAPSRPFSQNAERAVGQIRANGGMAVIAHPYHKVAWSWGEFIEYSGIEIINTNTMLQKAWAGVLPYAPLLLVRPEFVVCRMFYRPEKNLKKWDTLNRIHPVFGFYSVDAHLLYRPLLGALNLHILLEAPLSEDFDQAAAQVFSALRKGRFYNAVDGAAPAAGFRFWGEQNGRRLAMGTEAVPDKLPVRLEILSPSSVAHETRLIHNGRTVLVTREKRVSFPARDPGFYRVEVYLKQRSVLHKRIPWILSNPIFLREKDG